MLPLSPRLLLLPPQATTVFALLVELYLIAPYKISWLKLRNLLFSSSRMLKGCLGFGGFFTLSSWVLKPAEERGYFTSVKRITSSRWERAGCANVLIQMSINEDSHS